MSCNLCNNEKKTIRTEKEKKELINRVNRIVGSMNGIKNMIIDDRYCDDILIQLSAIDKSIKSLANLMLDNHIHSCVLNDVNKGNYEVLDEIVNLFKRFQ
ncbi:MAG: metal-sensing transcriptional repressor [Anaeroplasma sp.]|nr:metal-sensing transcriptional repressor [Anaeroplasma sp.]